MFSPTSFFRYCMDLHRRKQLNQTAGINIFDDYDQQKWLIFKLMIA